MIQYEPMYLLKPYNQWVRLPTCDSLERAKEGLEIARKHNNITEVRINELNIGNSTMTKRRIL